MNFVTKIIVVLTLICLCGEMSYARRGSKHRKHPEKSNSSEMDKQNSANGSVAFGTRKETTKARPSTTSRPPVKVKLVPHRSNRKHMAKRCCRIGYKAAYKKLFCMVDRYYSQEYPNKVHYARQRFQGRKPSRHMTRFMDNLEFYCIKPQLKSVFYKCCMDGILTAREKAGQ